MKPTDANSKTTSTARRSRRPSPAEARLDALLTVRTKSPAGQATPTTPLVTAPISVLDRLRQLFEGEICGAFEDLREKYAVRGIALTLDVAPFLRGGVDIAITIEFRGAGLRLDGTVTPNVIAFRQTRYDPGNTAGLTGSGPTLRTRDLTATSFRDFVCERMSALLQSVLGRP